jgi:nucleotide-binding universal stress UspA family protein
MFRTILVPLDGSKRAEKILPYVEELAYARESRVIFLQVVEPATFLVGPYYTRPYYSQEMAESAFKGAKAYLQALTEEFCAKGLSATSLVRQGLVIQTILEVAEQEKADLIAMASHGRTGLARVFYGSVAAGLLQQVERPLLLIRSGESS